MNDFGEAPLSRSDSQDPASVATAGPGELTVITASLEDWSPVAEWADGEGWNVGVGDGACFHPTDPAGFFIGRVGSRPVSAVSIVNYSDQYAFLGHYLVHPDLRGRGLGFATWQAAFPHAGTRTVGLDAMPAQEANYRKCGFVPEYDTIRYAGRPERSGTVAAGTVAVAPEHLDAIAAYDRACFPTDRRAFVSRWLTAAGHTAYARLSEGRITGYGVIRPAHEGYRIGPLFADTPQDAEALFDSLTAHIGPVSEVSLDVPEPRNAASALVTARGLTARFHTVRMYTGPVAGTRAERVFAGATLELG
ncbi:GNAT family N-acetyltransferase [Streptomyces sp. H27-D2]|uniref:GNAT family N-acetyltransferase n=1 Tax=Streptomyces sp. H27-D2 TaxID=3046304 RepID=UPI002DBA05C0|nr:GNAT family N-acetyltransferase [Streptomyces sp. H27-D2]MEC4019449.1 GNAT family N-acetyltransferase [Streptomyces sp. H27-D2]